MGYEWARVPSRPLSAEFAESSSRTCEMVGFSKHCLSIFRAVASVGGHDWAAVQSVDY